MSDIDELLEEQLKDKDFQEAWEETELEYQKYLKNKQDWEKMLEEITGTPEKRRNN